MQYWNGVPSDSKWHSNSETLFFLSSGEDALSFAYDGRARKVTCGSEEEFGEPFCEGDIIGCYAVSDFSLEISLAPHIYVGCTYTHLYILSGFWKVRLHTWQVKYKVACVYCSQMTTNSKQVLLFVFFLSFGVKQALKVWSCFPTSTATEKIEILY